MEKDLQEGLNAEQCRAVCHGSGPELVERYDNPEPRQRDLEQLELLAGRFENRVVAQNPKSNPPKVVLKQQLEISILTFGFGLRARFSRQVPAPPDGFFMRRARVDFAEFGFFWNDTGW